jgi:predicted AAA+ superfamily ATPase
MKPPLYFYRDKEGNEIDLLIEDSGTIHPLEIKKHANPSKKDITTFKILDSIPTIKRGSGGVICVYESLVALEGKDRVIPVSYL